jgi:anti-anti-sigma factor
MSLPGPNDKEKPRKIKPLYPLKNGLSADLLKIVNEPQIFELRLHGTIDQRTAHYFKSILTEIIEPQGTNLILNCKELSYASSAAWPIISAAAHSLKTKRLDLSLVELKGIVKNTFYLLQFDHVIRNFDTINEAIRYFERFSDPASDDSVAKSEARTRHATHLADEVTEELSIDKPTHDNFFIETKEIPFALNQAAFKASETTHSIPEKIKLLLRDYGPLSYFEMLKFLKMKEFGETKINIFKLFSILKSMGLNSRKKIEKFCGSA